RATVDQVAGELGARAAASVRSRYALPAVLAEWDSLFEAVRGRS
ncbi:glycosyltransferase family 4 protein, partial [Bordetella petrii]|nr:glycosyltransferase family 4 protein [Bordetella petrii]